jgi:hypothetical protein
MAPTPAARPRPATLRSKLARAGGTRGNSTRVGGGRMRRIGWLFAFVLFMGVANVAMAAVVAHNYSVK